MWAGKVPYFSSVVKASDVGIGPSTGQQDCDVAEFAAKAGEFWENLGVRICGRVGRGMRGRDGRNAVNPGTQVCACVGLRD